MRQYGYVGLMTSIASWSHRAALLLVAVAWFATQLGAQPPAGPDTAPAIRNSRGCNPTPAPSECRSFALTNLGVYTSTRHSGYNNPETQVVTDIGFLVNVGTQSAFGGSFYASAGVDLLVGGPMLRYRHWLAGKSSLDLGLGAGVIKDSRHNVSAMGLIKFNANERFGIAVRPEYLTVERNICSSFACESVRTPVRRMSMGVEAGSGLGRTMYGVMAVTAAIVAIAALVSLNSMTIP